MALLSPFKLSKRNQIEEIKERLDIVDVAGKYLTSIKRSGANYFASCPFHNEKTPSFSINQDLQIYKCFGCGESGDVITLIQKLEGLTFPEALEKTAEMAGVVLEKKAYTPEQVKYVEQKKRIIDANNLACKYYNYLLLNHKTAKIAQEYCSKRKITKEIIEKFQIGYAPKGYEFLKKFLLKKGFTEKELVAWGLLVEKNGKIYDKFRYRLMFPIFDNQGNVIGFSGRQIEKSDYGPKYLNSPETIVYKKKNTLYGLYQAKEAIRKQKFVILVEGNVDILSSSRVGVENIVCPLGTALTEEQCKLMKRYADRIFLALDTDEAGEKAIIRGLKICQKVGLEIKALDLKDFQDSDELIMHDEKLWKKTVDNPIEIIELFVRRFSKKYDLGSPNGKSAFVKALLPFINALEDDVEKQAYIKKISEQIDLPEQTVLASISKKSVTLAKADFDPKPSKTAERAVYKKVDLSNRKNYLAALLLQNPKYIKEESCLDVYESWFVDFLVNWKNNADKKLLDQLEEKRRIFLEDLLMANLPETSADQMEIEIRKLFASIEKSKLSQQIKELKKQIQKKELSGEDEVKLLEKLKILSRKLLDEPAKQL